LPSSVNKLARDLDTTIVAIKCFWGKMKDNHLDNFTNWNRVGTMEIPLEGQGDQKNMWWFGLIGTGAH
jgi:hypothetical protein